MMNYHTPTTTADAIALLQSGAATIVAGGTDFYPSRAADPLDEAVVDISGIDPLRGITEEAGGHRIGALTTWSDIVGTRLPPSFRALQMAAAEVGGVQVQNVGTVAGNLCNASPAADGVPPLLALGASVEITGASGPRVVSLQDFIVGYRRTALLSGELVTAVLVPPHPAASRSTFRKLGIRRYLVISIVMVAVNVSFDDRRIVTEAAVSVGAAGPVASRMTTLEDDLVGWPVEELASRVEPTHFTGLDPIDDVRAPAAYRLGAAATLTRRALAEVGLA